MIRFGLREAGRISALPMADTQPLLWQPVGPYYGRRTTQTQMKCFFFRDNNAIISNHNNIRVKIIESPFSPKSRLLFQPYFSDLLKFVYQLLRHPSLVFPFFRTIHTDLRIIPRLKTNLTNGFLGTKTIIIICRIHK